MSIMQIVHLVIAVITIGLGVWATLMPRSAQSFTGLRVEGGRGITEIRAVLGGLFIGLGAAPFILGSPVAYQMLGIAYLFIAAVRAPAMIFDRSIDGTNLLSVAVEIVFGVLLLL